MQNVKLLIAIILGTLIMIVGSAWALSKLASPQEAAIEVPPESIVTAEAPMKGASESARFTIVEFSDFQCPACAAARPQVMALLQRYPNDVRLVYRHFPLMGHPNAEEAAWAAEAARESGKFWEMHDKLFLGQNAWGPEKDPLPYFITYAKELGIEETAFIMAYTSDAVKERVNVDANQATQLKLQFTPSFFLNGKLLSLEEIEAQLAQELGQ